MNASTPGTAPTACAGTGSTCRLLHLDHAGPRPVWAALDAAGERYVRFNYPELGTLVWTDDVMGEITGVDEGEVAADGNMEITVSIAVNTVVASAAYVAP